MADSLAQAAKDAIRANSLDPTKRPSPTLDPSDVTISHGFVSGKAFTYIDGGGMMHSITPDGVNRVIIKRYPSLERGSMTQVNGIVVHQTDSSSSSSVFASYKNPKANGAHFLIDKDGTIYQTGSLYQRMDHVGYLQSRCERELRCTRPKSLRTKKAISLNEGKKSFPDRYPSNKDSIGIELVGRSHPLAPGQSAPLPGEDRIYEPVTAKQNEALQWLIKELAFQFRVHLTEIYRHPEIGRKTSTEASTAKWK